MAYPSFTLNDGNNIPAVGLGTFQGANDLVIRIVSSAIDLGYRSFDTATLYKTEEPLGIVIKQNIEQGVIKREDVFITTKLWCTSHRRQDVVLAMKESLRCLGMDYVDLYLVHYPVSTPASSDLFPTNEKGEYIFNDDEVPLAEVWQGMEDCVTQKLARSIGVSNYNKRQIETTLKDCKIRIAVNQVESHPFYANKKLVEFCQSEGIHITCCSPMAKPKRPWLKEGDPVITSDPTLIRIGKKYNKSPGQVALRYQYQRGNSVVPRSSNSERQKQNIDIFDFNLTDEDMKAIINLDQNVRMLYSQKTLGGSKEYPFNDEY